MTQGDIAGLAVMAAVALFLLVRGCFRLAAWQDSVNAVIKKIAQHVDGDVGVDGEGNLFAYTFHDPTPAEAVRLETESRRLLAKQFKALCELLDVGTIETPHSVAFYHGPTGQRAEIK